MRVDISVLWAKIQNLMDQSVILLPNLILSVVVFSAFYVLGKWLRTIVQRITEKYKRAQNLGRLMGRLAQSLVMMVGVLIALSVIIPTFNARDLIQLLGIGSVAIGFAFRDIFQNFLAGILLLFTEPFRIDDQIVVNNYEGTVEDIQTRATTIKTYDGRRVVIPNSTLFTQSVTVNTAFAYRRSEVEVGISYKDDINRAKELILETMSEVDGVLDKPAPDAFVVALAPSTVNIRARWWTDSRRTQVLVVQDKVITAIKECLLLNGIDLPYPTQELLVYDRTSEAQNGNGNLAMAQTAGNGRNGRH